MGERRFCVFFIAFSASGSGVSIPKNTLVKNASCIIFKMCGWPAMFSVASQERRTW